MLAGRCAMDGSVSDCWLSPMAVGGASDSKLLCVGSGLGVGLEIAAWETVFLGCWNSASGIW